MTDDELIDRARKRIRKGDVDVVRLLFDARDVLDCVAYEIREDGVNLDDPTWNPTYHLRLTITVEDARSVLKAVERLDKFFQGKR